MWPDIINSLFEFIGGLAIFAHCWKLYKDKVVRGVFWPSTFFFTAWGFWNLFFYSHLGQWWSWGAGILIAVANITWCVMLAYYIKKERYAPASSNS